MIALFADRAYLPLLTGWIGRVRALGLAPDLVVFALDAETAQAAAAGGVAHAALPPVADLDCLWRLRVRAFAALARAGIGFVHSDADALWLADPRARMAAFGADLVFSQGTVWPHDVVRDWGFVLCCGLFQARATPAVLRFFDSVAARPDLDSSDQAPVNRALRAQGVVWDAPGAAGLQRQLQGCDFTLLSAPVTGRAGDLRLAVLPHHAVPRLPEPPPPGALVVHPLSPKRPEDKLALFRALGLWQEAPAPGAAAELQEITP